VRAFRPGGNTARVGEPYGDDVPERLIRDLLRLDDRVLVGRMLEEWPDPARALPLVERWRARLVAGAEDEVADRWLELMRNAEYARSEGNTPLYETLLEAAAEWDEDVET
jgi:hypothetical protein